VEITPLYRCRPSQNHLWRRQLATAPKLSRYGVTEADIPLIVANSRGSSMLSNPIVLQDAEIADLVRQRL